MKAIVKENKNKGVACVEIRKPILRDDEVLIKVELAAICGTDFEYYDWGEVAKKFTKNKKLEFPFIIGHECTGKIVDVGKRVQNRKFGDRVVIEPHIPCGNCYMCANGYFHNCENMKVFGIDINGGFAEYVAVAANATFLLPDSVPFIQAVLFEPAGVAMHAISKANIGYGDYVLVNGCGSIGLFVVQLLMHTHVSLVIATDIDEKRLNKAREMGAQCINVCDNYSKERVLEISKRHGGVDVVIEASGASNAYPFVFDILRREGTIVCVGHPRETIAIDIMGSINVKGITMRGIFGREIWKTWQQLTSFVLEQHIDLSKNISGVFGIREYEKAFYNAKNEVGKTVFRIEGGLL